jgi:protein CpxP
LLITAQPNQKVKATGEKHQKVSAEQRAKNATDTLQKITGLSADQYQKVYDINLAFYTQKRTLKTQMKSSTSSTNDVQYKEQIKQLAKYRRADIEKVLTPEQKTKWQEFKKQNAAKIKANSPKGKFNKVDDDDDSILEGM